MCVSRAESSLVGTHLAPASIAAERAQERRQPAFMRLHGLALFANTVESVFVFAQA